MRFNKFLFLFLSLVFIAFSGFASSLDKSKITKITITFFGDPASSKGFTWFTDLSSKNSNLEVIEKKDLTPDFSKAIKFSGITYASNNSKEENIHKAEAFNLKENTSYFFKLGDASADIWSEVKIFETSSKTSAFTFINLTDTQAKTPEEAQLVADTLKLAQLAIKNSKFILHGGDHVESGGKEEQWDLFIEKSKNTFLSTTFVPTAGNHEKTSNSFINHFDLKVEKDSDTRTGSYYSFDYSNAHFVILNTNEDSDEYANFSLKQIEWLEKDVLLAKKNGSKWIIVSMHKGPYTTSNHATNNDIMGTNGVRNKLVPLFSKLKIDLVLQGHDHIYARTKPIKNGNEVKSKKTSHDNNGLKIEYYHKPDGTIYLIPNTAGPKVYAKNKKIDASYYDLFEISDENHAFEFEHGKKSSDKPLRGLVQNFIGFNIDGNKLTAIVYEVDQRKNSSEPFIIDTFGIIK